MKNKISDTSVFIAGSGRLGTALLNGLRDEAQKVYTGIKGNYVQGEYYRVGNLWRPSGVSVGIVATTNRGVEEALDDFSRHKIPTIIASTDISGDLENENIPLFIASNLALPVAELAKIFQDTESFIGINMKIDESHQVNKRDPSGTALDMISIFQERGGAFDLSSGTGYRQGERVSNIGDLRCFRGSFSSQIGVPNRFMDSHAYHRYHISGKNTDTLQSFKKAIQNWVELNKNIQGCEVFFEEGKNGSEFSFGHNIRGHDVYVSGVKKLIPWILEQKSGLYS